MTHPPTARQLENQVVIVTGAGRGLGRSIALSLAAEGASVLLVARTHSQLEETATIVRDAGGSVDLISAE